MIIVNHSFLHRGANRTIFYKRFETIDSGYDKRGGFRVYFFGRRIFERLS